jgi:glycosyltransferase involved in cell wall biosynthesis
MFRPLILIPSYNTGRILLPTVEEILAYGISVLVVIDGSTDGSQNLLDELPQSHLHILKIPKNGGKGSAVLQGAEWGVKHNFTHLLTMDSDGQHNASDIPNMLNLSQQNPQSMIMGCPEFGQDAPFARVWGRKLTIGMTNLETGFCGLGDTLYGMRVYPLSLFVKTMHGMRFGKGYDFDPEIAVRMCWNGVKPIRFQTKVRYVAKEEGGISHFHYLRDNCKLTLLHFRLVPEYILRILRFIK